MRNLRLLLLGILGYLLFAPGKTASAQGQANDIIYSRFAAFKIPYQTDGRESRLAELQLYVSTDLGKQWQKSFVTSPSQRYFRFEAPADGLYWFTVQTKDRDG